MIPAHVVAKRMSRNKLVLVTAESCTPGLIASSFSEVPNARSLLDCAFVTYTIATKQACLGVSLETIQAFNLTSERVAREMALGALSKSRANLAIANTDVVDNIEPCVPAGTQ